MVDHLTVKDTLVEILQATSKDVMHAGNPVWMVICGDACVGGILFLLVVEEGVFDCQIVGREDVTEVLVLGVASGYAVRSKHLQLFIASVCTNVCIDVAANDDLGG